MNGVDTTVGAVFLLFQLLVNVCECVLVVVAFICRWHWAHLKMVLHAFSLLSQLCQVWGEKENRKTGKTGKLPHNMCLWQFTHEWSFDTTHKHNFSYSCVAFSSSNWLRFFFCHFFFLSLTCSMDDTTFTWKCSCEPETEIRTDENILFENNSCRQNFASISQQLRCRKFSSRFQFLMTTLCTYTQTQITFLAFYDWS